MAEEQIDRTQLMWNEPHPMAIPARNYIVSLGFEKLLMYQDAFSSCAIEGNRLAEVCGGTLNRLLTGKPVSDRYVLGLAWYLKEYEEGKDVLPDD